MPLFRVAVELLIEAADAERVRNSACMQLDDVVAFNHDYDPAWHDWQFDGPNAVQPVTLTAEQQVQHDNDELHLSDLPAREPPVVHLLHRVPSR